MRKEENLYKEAQGQAENEKPVKPPRRRVRNVIAVILVIIFAAAFSFGTACTVIVANAGVSIEEALCKYDYFQLRSTQEYANTEVIENCNDQLEEAAFWENGEYNEDAKIDISNLAAGILYTDKNPSTTYRMADLVTMYGKDVEQKIDDMIQMAENVPADYPEIIAKMEAEYQTSEYFVDSLGRLYAFRNGDGGVIEDYLNFSTSYDAVYAADMCLYIIEGDQVKACPELPEDSGALMSIGWEEFASRYMFGLSDLDPDILEELYYGNYGPTFQYLYMQGRTLDLILPESGEYIGDYALQYPGEVSLMDTYKQLSKAIQKVGLAVESKQFENQTDVVESDIPPYAYYWISAGDKYWTNNPAWDTDVLSDVQEEILSRETDAQDGNEYPAYTGNTYYALDEDVYDHTNEFSSEYANYLDIDHYLQYGAGLTEAQYVMAINPLMTDSILLTEMSQWFYNNYVTYEFHYGNMHWYLLSVAAGAVGVIVFAVLSVVWAGKRDKTKARYAGRFAKNVPIEALLLLDVGAWIAYALVVYALIYTGIWNVNYSGYGGILWDCIVPTALGTGFAALAAWQILTLVIKGKSKNMRTNSLIGRAGKGAVNAIDQGVKASAFTRKCPIEIMAAIFLVIWIIVMLIIATLLDGLGYYGPVAFLIVAGGSVIGCILLAIWHILTFVHKGKSGNMLTNSIIKMLVKAISGGIKKFYKNRKVTGKLMCLALIICAGHLVIIGVGFATEAVAMAVILLIIIWILLIVLLMKKCLQKQRIKDGIHEIAGGNIDYQIKMDKLTGDELDMAWDLNNIKEGMGTALERMMKSERMKTDLITNVSHDLKTPLTSIINYVDILKKEDIQDPKIRGYIEILEQKSLRLKNLTEDLMEAAKISSGNIALEWQNLNLKQLLYQTNGEFEEKFAKRNLQLVCTLPDSDVYICADGRRMWRVIENLYNNAAKYAQPYSRVYVDGKLQAGKVELIIKNVSEAPLNISADELMERFVRGDVARNTEGSGLGLEIARNLTVMQKGTFDIQLDGDLFKVILTFDAV